jgi:hypothetical protein
MQFSRGLWLAMLAPLVIITGPALGSALFIGLVVLDWRTRWLFDSTEESQIQAVVDKGLAKLRGALPW